MIIVITLLLKEIKVILNNSFETHGLDHISAAQINSFIYSPYLWLCRVANLDKSFGASMFRGKAIGIAAAHIGENNGGKHSALALAEQTYFKELKDNGIPQDDPKAQKELGLVQRTVEMLSHSFDEKVIESEREVWVELDDIPVPIKGYVDMLCEDKIIELKSKPSTQSSLEHSANLQASVYQEALGLDAYVYYAYPKGVSIFKANHAVGISRAKQTAFAMQNILSLSSDVHEIIRMYFRPNPDDYRIGDVELDFYNSIIGENYDSK